MRRTDNSVLVSRVVTRLLTPAVVVLGVAGCASTGSALEPTGASATTVTSAAPVLSHDEYQARLTALAQAVRPAVDQVLGAGSEPDLVTARATLADLLADQYEELSAVRPPAEAADAHRDLLWALDFGQELKQEGSALGAAEPNSCGLPPPLESQLYDVKHAIYLALNSGSLDNARQGLAALGLTLDGVLPPEPAAPALPSRRADNGQIIQRTGKGGNGELEIDNNTGADHTISVVTGGNPSEPQVMVYVRANSTARVNRIAGTYQVYLKSGTDWDAERRGFTRDCAFEKFDEPFDQSSDWEISLAETTSGNAESSVVPPF
ncbi:hypothetical protein [Goodfellowiella coeruleoviolacea]|uniref:Lipoprotein n=1 Tax=Goodfellowiella coeruleoviolacea TaxID=334858 RepID=A0AAE3GEH5_9PSEU|nr:hypothetical protein [Goodfellowiella coeruleoviolacea]MCP2166787.1 hypothetical protein [Goodfellowiella coeruleoviolacea]